MSLTAVSLFAGIGGIDEALRRAGVRVVAAVEIDPACRGVLARHFPDAVLFDDVRTVTGDQLRAAGFVPGRGILAGGWPCTGNSIAGRRQGMADPRSGLWVQFARLLAELRPRWFLGENVPGLYSVNDGRDIAIVRRDLAQLGYWWAERTLDAQYFGVPQRRRRVFFAGCLGDRAAPVQVLLEPESSGRDSAPGGQARQGAAGGAANGPGGPRTVGTLGTTSPGGGWRVGADEAAAGQLVASTLQGGGRRGHRVDAEGAAGGHLVPSAPLPSREVSHAITSREGKGADSDATSGLIAIPLALRGREGGGGMIAHTLTSEGFDASEDGTGRGIPIVPMGMPPVAAPLTSGTATGAGVNRPGRRQEDDYNLVAMATALQASQTTAVALSENQRGEFRETPYSRQITTGGGKPGQGYPAVREGMAVRRLTPLECERLQGFPEVKRTLRIEVWNCSDHPKNLVLAGGQSHRSQKSASSAGALESRDPASSAVSHSPCCLPDLALPVVASVHFDCEAGEAEILSPDGRRWSVNGAVPSDSPLLAVLLDASARAHALTPHSQAQAAPPGRAASPPSPGPSTPQPSGVICVPVCGLEIDGSADGAHECGATRWTSHSMSTTSRVGRASRNSGLTWATLCSSVVNSIGSFIPLPTPGTTSYAVELTTSAGWTKWLADGTEQSDSARYRQCGNSVAVPVVEWIARRTVAVDASLRASAGVL